MGNRFNKQKAFGQHFLSDEGVIQEIIHAAEVSLTRNQQSALLEIGPGKGAMTRPLIQLLQKEGLSRRFYVSERDRDLIDYWKPESSIHELLEGDFLNITDETLDRLGKLVVVSNLPYSAGTAIVVRLAERASQVQEMVLMFQAEVAKRLYAKASTPDRGSLSLYIQNEWQIDKLISVKPGSFTPPPQVMSEVVRLVRRSESYIPVKQEDQRTAWNDLLKQAFKQRRKMLKGNFSGTAWQEAFLKSGVDPTKRAESLEWEEWVKIWRSRFSD